jgi:hypothetical protein
MLCISLQVSIDRLQFVLGIHKSGAFAGQFGMDLGNNIWEFRTLAGTFGGVL